MSITIHLTNPSFDRHDEAFLDKHIAPLISHSKLAGWHLQRVRQFVMDSLVKDSNNKPNYDLVYKVQDIDPDQQSLLSAKEEVYQLLRPHLHASTVLTVRNLNTAFADRICYSIRRTVGEMFVPTTFGTLSETLRERKAKVALYYCHQMAILARSLSNASHYQLEMSQNHALFVLHGGDPFNYTVSTIIVLPLTE